MRTPGNETIVVKPELIRLVRRDDSKKWQANYKLENLKTWFRRSTDTANVKEAVKIQSAQVVKIQSTPTWGKMFAFERKNIVFRCAVRAYVWAW